MKGQAGNLCDWEKPKPCQLQWIILNAACKLDVLADRIDYECCMG